MSNRREGVTVAQKLGRWLQQSKGAFCDRCLARELELSGRRQANRAVNELAGTHNFYRTIGTCSICGAERKVIEAV